MSPADKPRELLALAEKGFFWPQTPSLRQAQGRLWAQSKENTEHSEK